MLKNLKIKHKLGISFGIIILLIILLGVLNYSFLKHLKKEVNDIKEAGHLINDSQILVNSLLRSCLHLLEMQNLEQKIKQKLGSESKEHWEELEKALAVLKKETEIQKGKEIIAKVESLLEEIKTFNEKVLTLNLKGEQKSASEIYHFKVAQKVEEISDLMDEYLNLLTSATKKESAQAQAYIDRTMEIMGIISGVVIFIALLFFFVISASIQRPVEYLVRILERVKSGDLSVEIAVKTRDEIGIMMECLRGALRSIKDLIKKAQDVSTQLASSSEELSVTSSQVKDNLASQSERTSQIASSAEEMSITVVDIAKNASSISELSTKTLEVAREGKEMTEKTSEEIKVIEDSAEKLLQIMTELEQSSEEIGNIVNIIKEIAEQTNLLALNATIEAARAGEHGKSFAVVAGEIRKLAEKTDSSTGEIAQFIHRIQSIVDDAKKAVEETNAKMAEGVELSEKASEFLEEISKKAEDLQTMIHQIASATEEMSTVTDQIAKDIGEVAQGTKEISTAIEQTAQTAEIVAKLGAELKSAIGKFKI